MVVKCGHSEAGKCIFFKIIVQVEYPRQLVSTVHPKPSRTSYTASVY